MKVFVSVVDRSSSNYIYIIMKDFNSVEFWGITDENLESIGFKSVGRLDELSVVGLWEAIPKIPTVIKLLRRIEKLAGEMDAVILCDAPAFNLLLLKRIREKAKKIIYFISPQVWAWKEERAKLISKLADYLIVILPFEVEFYKRYGKEAIFVGHPLVDLAKPTLPEEKVKSLIDWDEYIVILPGSRWSEIKNHARYLRRAYQAIYEKTKLPAVIPTFESFRRKLEDMFEDLPVRVFTALDLEQPNYNLSAYAKFGLVASGTAELELSLLGVPHVVFYRVNPITYCIGKRLVKVKNIALTNLILEESVIPEVVQRPWQDLVEAFMNMDFEAQKRAFLRLRERLGGEGSIERLRAKLREILLGS
ncbi:lipid-A-disaccharide synthase [Thermocrinis jamiesonii]|jgi:lipid-A-disaccharide synthase (EC 2.4.1.182)|uniref:lipid-A-disaccharide synthase n=1 Tax=Thermocrinis jamiesonii TaxID=1302351 RepID=UPI0004952803|nr:lipid-A-disaccharide synthase [Thermocrinis jamiesonii]